MSESINVSIKRLNPEATIPTRAHDGDAAMDLHALNGAETIFMRAGERCTVGTGIAVAIPEGFAGIVSSRSGLAFKSGVAVLNSAGLIDSGYRGELKVCLHNSSEETVWITNGDRVAQLLIVPIPTVTIKEVHELPDNTDARGHNGFGSTG